MAEADLRNMIMNFRVSDLQVLLGFAGRNKTGKKQELQSRALDLVKLKSPAVEMKIKELHNRRYHHQLHVVRPNNYDIPERTLTDRPISNYDSAMNNNYAMRCNTNIRPMSMNPVPSPSYSGKPYLPTVSSQPPFSAYADVRFKELPFFDTLHILMKPFILAVNPLDRCQESSYTFTLSPQEAHDLSVSKDSSGNYECQILLRFCILEAGTEQDDNFPPNISLKVNGKPVPLPNPIPTNRPGVEPKRPSKPVNITQYTKLSPTVTNVINVTWSSAYGRSYAAVLYIARLLSSYTLLQRLKNRGLRGAEHTKAMIVEKLQQGQDSDIAPAGLQVSLICPLGKLKMELPCRSISCTHVACFDASLYIQLNEKKPKWRCPVCDKSALFKTLVLDGLFMDIVNNVSPACTDVQFHDDGSWTPIMPTTKESKEVKKAIQQTKKHSPEKSVEIVDISSDSDTDDQWKAPQASIPLQNDSPPVMFMTPDPNLLSQCPTPPVTDFSPVSSGMNIDFTSSNSQPMVEPIPMCMTSNGQRELQTSAHLNILPDLIYTDNAIPSTSNSDLTSAAYLSYPPSSESLLYGTSGTPFQNSCGTNSTYETEQPPPEILNDSTYKNCDIFSLLATRIPESEQQKYESLQKELAEKESESVPDIISLD